MKKKFAIILAVGLCLILFVLSPVFPFVRSLAVMSVYSGIHRQESLMKQEGIRLKIPGGLSTGEADWYPFVMTFNASEPFQRFIQDPSVKLTILYNFPAFSMKKGCSRLFDTASPYYNSFYGAYLVQREDSGAFGFTDGKLDLDQTAVVPRFDFWELVLDDFGLPDGDKQFDWQVVELTENVSYLGYDGWSRVEVDLTVNGAAHRDQGFVQSYLQYGAPAFPVTEEFEPVPMKGLVYGRYFEEWNTSIFFYVLATTEEMAEKCDEEILSRSVLE